jgi:hypothetical protein
MIYIPVKTWRKPIFSFLYPRTVVCIEVLADWCWPLVTSYAMAKASQAYGSLLLTSLLSKISFFFQEHRPFQPDHLERVFFFAWFASKGCSILSILAGVPNYSKFLYHNATC